MLGLQSGAVGIDKHLVFECVALASLRSRYAGLFTYSTDTMRSVCAQPDHIEVFYCVVDCLDITMIGTSLLLPLPTQLTSLEFMAGLPSWCVGYSCTHVSLGETYSGDFLKEGLNVRSRGRILQQSKTLKPTQRERTRHWEEEEEQDSAFIQPINIVLNCTDVAGVSVILVNKISTKCISCLDSLKPTCRQY